ncbi:hypothetical protein BT93_F0144 [Corymbia citriodora subsp. variegata]|nr:hypothetical protein BT93_F0144 [Corymbia citriodora subsp. variegata]
MCSEISSPPRMSFSYEPGQRDITTEESIKAESGPFCLSDRNSDFEFSISHSFDYESSSADELFANGMILPVQFQQRNNTAAPNGNSRHEGEALPSLLPPIPCPPSDESKKKASIKEIAVPSLDSEEKPISKSFWGFRRSSSLNSEGVQKKSLICSFPLLLRSNSTGSALNPKKAPQKQPPITLPKSSSLSSSSSSSTSSSSSSNVNSRPQKPPLKKNSHGTYYGHQVRVSPVLNVPTPSISKGTASFLGLGSFLGNGKDKKIRR